MAEKDLFKVKTGVCRLSYPNLFTAKKNDDDKDKYGCVLLIPKTDKATIAAVNAAVEAVRLDDASLKKWDMKAAPKTIKSPLRDADAENENEPEKHGEEYAGCYFINASSGQKPGVITRNGTDAIEAQVYAGCYVKASLRMYPFNFKGNKGVSAGLQNILLWSDGVPLAGRSRAADDFAEDIDETGDNLLE